MIAVRFDWPLRRLDHSERRSRFVYRDDSAVCVEQQFLHDGRYAATALASGLIREGRTGIAPERILEELGFGVPP